MDGESSPIPIRPAPTSSGTGPLIANYQLRLPSFEGPMDVLLRLIERNQLPISDVSLVAVTDQFLSYVSHHHVPSSALADFATIGSRLVLLKSRSLLPRPPVVDEEESEHDLVRELVEYQAVKEAAAELASLDLAGVGAFAHRPEAIATSIRLEAPRLARHQARSLVSALRRRLSVAAAATETLHVAPVVTLRQMAERILARLSSVPTLRFSSAVSTGATSGEVLTAFQAVLALVRRQTIVAEQSELFGEITLYRQGPGELGAIPSSSSNVGSARAR